MGGKSIDHRVTHRTFTSEKNEGIGFSELVYGLV
jgi:hypothetical protein